MDLRPENIIEISNAGFGGISWCQFLPAINLYTIGSYSNCSDDINKKYTAIYIDTNGYMEILKEFYPTSPVEHAKMIKQLTEWNYGTCELCPIVKLSLK